MPWLQAFLSFTPPSIFVYRGRPTITPNYHFEGTLSEGLINGAVAVGLAYRVLAAKGRRVDAPADTALQIALIH